MASIKDSPRRLTFEKKDAPKLVFQCCKPGIVENEERDTSSAAKLLEIFKKTLKEKSMDPLIEELERKEERIGRCPSPSPSIPTAEKNFSGSEDSLDTDEVELLTFVEVLTDAGYELPDALQNKRDEILTHRRIPARSIRDPEGPINNFFVYTLNKTLAEICGDLSAEEVFRMRDYIIKKSEIKVAEVENTDIEMTEIDLNEQELAQAVSVIESVESLQLLPGLKDAAFYYMILLMFKGKLLDSVHTQKLEDCLEGVVSPDISQPEHISRALTQLKKYQIARSPPGLCLILAMDIEREGNKNDVAAVRKFFESELNYDTILKMNPSVNDVRKMITKAEERRNQFYDSLVVWFMAHGDEAYLKVKDGEIHRRRDLIQPLVTIEWLQAKPKLFFIQACADQRKEGLYDDRGKKTGTDPLIIDDDVQEKMKALYAANTNYTSVNNFADTLVCYSTMWYQLAAHHKNGSLFIHTVLEVLAKMGRKVSIDSVLRETSLRMNSVLLTSDDDDKTWRQTPYYESSLQKKLIFPQKRTVPQKNPGAN